MNTLDEEIRKALSEDDRKAMDEIGKQASLWEMLAMSFRGKQAWMTWYMYILGAVVFFAGVYSFIQFHGSTDLQQSLAWMLAMQVCISVIVVIKILGWMQLQKLELMREIKRIELRQLLQREQS